MLPGTRSSANPAALSTTAPITASLRAGPNPVRSPGSAATAMPAAAVAVRAPPANSSGSSRWALCQAGTAVLDSSAPG